MVELDTEVYLSFGSVFLLHGSTIFQLTRSELITETVDKIIENDAQHAEYWGLFYCIAFYVSLSALKRYKSLEVGTCYRSLGP